MPGSSPGHTGSKPWQQLQQAWGNWLSELRPWDWYATMTFRSPDPHETGLPYWTKPGWKYTDRRWNEWISTTSQNAGFGHSESVSWVRCREYHKDRGVTHFHALIAGTKDQRRDDAWSRWFTDNGIARIEPYNPHQGAGFYLCKYVTKEVGEIVFSPSIGGLTKAL